MTKYINLIFRWLIPACSIYVSGCASVEYFDYKPSTNAKISTTTVRQARDLISPYFTQGIPVVFSKGWTTERWKTEKITTSIPLPYITTNSIIVREKNDKPAAIIPLSESEFYVHYCQVYAKHNGKVIFAGYYIMDLSNVGFGLHTDCDKDFAKSLADALVVLKNAASTAQNAEQQQFEQVSQSHSASMTRALPENARRYEVMAQDAVRDKKFDEAAEDYLQLIAQAPWWPQGYYNHALLLSNIGDYAHAVTEMQRYLALAPMARNARAVQDKIYSWQRNLTQ
jgi:hypothetical protein